MEIAYRETRHHVAPACSGKRGSPKIGSRCPTPPSSPRLLRIAHICSDSVRRRGFRPLESTISCWQPLGKFWSLEGWFGSPEWLLCSSGDRTPDALTWVGVRQFCEKRKPRRDIEARLTCRSTAIPFVPPGRRDGASHSFDLRVVFRYRISQVIPDGEVRCP